MCDKCDSALEGILAKVDAQGDVGQSVKERFNLLCVIMASLAERMDETTPALQFLAHKITPEDVRETGAKLGAKLGAPPDIMRRLMSHMDSDRDAIQAIIDRRDREAREIVQASAKTFADHLTRAARLAAESATMLKMLEVPQHPANTALN